MTQAVQLLLVLLGFVLVCHVIWIFLLVKQKRGHRTPLSFNPNGFLIVYATQSGQTQYYAEQTLLQLNALGEQAHCLDIAQLDSDTLQSARRVLWMVSTYGEGDAPDSAQTFVQQFLHQSFDLSNQEFAVLAFGDRHYTHFCGFGQRLFQWLSMQQAQPYFDMVSVDQSSQDDLAHWSNQLSQVTQHQFQLNAQQKIWHELELIERNLLNSGSHGTGLYHIKFTPAQDMTWQSGDILEIQCVNTLEQMQAFLDQHPYIDQQQISVLKRKNLRIAPKKSEDQSTQQWLDQCENLPMREYSIASLPQQKHLALVVRQEVRGQELGLGSGLLTQHLHLNQSIQACVRQHSSFHLHRGNVPMIFIGNGSGIAGLLGHLHQREVWGYHRNWLIFGERNRQYDHVFSTQLERWEKQGFLPALSLVFSRDGHAQRYVQDVLYTQQDQLRQWVDQGAYIYVCGRLKGMGEGVDQALHDILSSEQMQKLRDAERYRRDVY